MNSILNIYKPIGMTPLQVIQNLREEQPEFIHEKIGYAGRLDPLAHGVILLMVGGATKERDKYLSLPKEYEFEVLFGVETDTYDVLGHITSNRHPGLDPGSIPLHGSSTIMKPPKFLNPDFHRDDVRVIVNKNVNTFVNKHIGKQIQSYPPYSSKTVQGKPLFWWARNGRLSEIEIPKREIEIYAFELLTMNEVTSDALLQLVQKHVQAVKGDFRQEQILGQWSKCLNGKKIFQTAKFRISSSSGTYVRGLVHEMGKVLGTGAIALDILRTRVGTFCLEDALHLESFSSR